MFPWQTVLEISMVDISLFSVLYIVFTFLHFTLHEIFVACLALLLILISVTCCFTTKPCCGMSCEKYIYISQCTVGNFCMIFGNVFKWPIFHKLCDLIKIHMLWIWKGFLFETEKCWELLPVPVVFCILITCSLFTLIWYKMQ